MGTILKHCYVFMSHEFQTVYCNWAHRKSPLILKEVVAIAYVATILTSKIKMLIIGNDSEVFRMSGNLNNNVPPDRDGRKDEARFNFRCSRASLY